MWTDPIVDEVRKLREDYAAKFQFDIRAICDAMREEEAKSGRPLVTRPRKKPPAELLRDAS